ncbi:MAG: EamA/RhaT family transporter [Bacteroidetes bacterium]|nr:EamA/RhaT family transporter [Bacteroidota bacterium]
MIYLVLSILSSTLINAVFKIFQRFEIENRLAITINYFTCVLTGLMVVGGNGSELIHLSEFWVRASLILGLMFLLVFLGMAITAQVEGISVSVVAAKMGVVFPVTYAMVFLHESLDSKIVVGIALSLLSVWLISRNKLKGKKAKSTVLGLLPFLVFVGSGTIDMSLKILESKTPVNVPEEWPVILIFASAAIAGSVMLFLPATKPVQKMDRKHVLAGVLLGIPNFFSIYFLYMTIHSGFLKTAQVFPVNNVGVVLVSTLVSLVFFKEHLGRLNVVGLITAVLAIVLISGF